ncbi:11368_t:CDS:2, partial [Scutellospora calospora]
IQEEQHNKEPESCECNKEFENDEYYEESENYECNKELENDEINKEPEHSPESESLPELKSLFELESLLELESPLKPKKAFFKNGRIYSFLEVFNDSVRCIQVFTCDHYSQFKPKPKDPNKKNRNVELKKCRCLWSIRLTYDQNDEKYYISQSILYYNYPFIPIQFICFLPSNCEISEDIKEEIHLAKKAGISTLQIQSLLQKCNSDPEFSYEFELNQENHLKHVIWVYASQKQQYIHFHNMIVFVNTYKYNYFSMPFRLFGAFLRIFGTALQTILINNDLPMGDTIFSVLTEKHDIKHGLCIWHMLKNIKTNMTSKLGVKYNEFHKNLIKCFNHCIDQNQFEEQLNSIVENEDYSEASAYLKDHFFADMFSTQRGESMNKLLKSFLDCKIRLTDFLAAFKQAFDHREEAKLFDAVCLEEIHS